MCEASVYLLKDDKEELFLDSVDILEPQEDGKIYM
ncbi:MAG: CooT family nickel-binding protein, partial [Nitrospirota bacterium]|nr:CooT family nickel-binding protein [Nitrospirota bacterium]